MLTKIDKALMGFIVAFVTALIAEVNTGTHIDTKTVLLALGTALVTSYSVYQTPNKQ